LKCNVGDENQQNLFQFRRHLATALLELGHKLSNNHISFYEHNSSSFLLDSVLLSSDPFSSKLVLRQSDQQQSSSSSSFLTVSSSSVPIPQESVNSYYQRGFDENNTPHAPSYPLPSLPNRSQMMPSTTTEKNHHHILKHSPSAVESIYSEDPMGSSSNLSNPYALKPSGKSNDGVPQSISTPNASNNLGRSNLTTSDKDDDFSPDLSLPSPRSDSRESMIEYLLGPKHALISNSPEVKDFRKSMTDRSQLSSFFY
jgi:hypothetical protein